MKRRSSFSSTAVLGLACTAAFFPTVALADNPNFAHGDLVLTFQQEGGSNTIYANLGNAATLFRGTASGPGAANMINFKDISTALTSAFGAGWADDTTIYVGLAGVWGTSSTSGTVQDGDPQRTLYVSASRLGVGTEGQANSAGYTINTNTGMTTGAQNMRAMNNWFFVNSVDAVTVAEVGVSLIDDQNPFLFAGVQGDAYEIFGGGVQQAGTAGSFGSMGDAGTVEFALDLYRILGKTNASGQISGPLREGTFEGTITVNSSGQVSFISENSSSGSAFDIWMATFPTITDPADKLSPADPDGDGITNLEEFALGGNPGDPTLNGVRLVQTVDSNGDSLEDLSLTLEVRSGAVFAPSGNTLVATVDGISYRIEGSLDLVNWDSPVSEETALGSGIPGSGYVFKTFRLNASNGLAGRGFLRGVISE